MPTLIRWPFGLIARIDEETTRRRKGPQAYRWWATRSRAQTIRDLVAERLKVSARDGSRLKDGAK